MLFESDSVVLVHNNGINNTQKIELMKINETELSDTDQYRFRMLKAKAEYLRLRPGVNKDHAGYARTIWEHFPEVDMERARRVVSFQIIDEDILSKLEKCNEIWTNR